MILQVIRIKDEKTLVLQNPETEKYASINLTTITPEFRAKCMKVKEILGTTLSISGGAKMSIDDDDIKLVDTLSKTGETGKIYNIIKLDSLKFKE